MWHFSTRFRVMTFAVFGVSRSHSSRNTTLGRTRLDEWSARRRDLCLTTQNTHKRQKSMPQPGFGPRTLAGERSKTHALGRVPLGSAVMMSMTIDNTTTEIIETVRAITYIRTAEQQHKHAHVTRILNNQGTWAVVMGNKIPKINSYRPTTPGQGRWAGRPTETGFRNSSKWTSNNRSSC
jgi:hypothetical protein